MAGRELVNYCGVGCSWTLRFLSKFDNLLSECVQGKPVRHNSTHTESNMHMQLKQETKAMQILQMEKETGAQGIRISGQERSKDVFSVSSALTTEETFSSPPLLRI